MSFDLYFCVREGHRYSAAHLQRHLQGLEYMTESQSDDGSLIQFEYSSPSTGVYCLFDLSSAPDRELEQELALAEGHEYADLSVSINFLRPHFFALEVMPIVSAIADDLELSIYDSQDDRMYSPGTSAQVLVSSWMRHNEKVTRNLAMEKDPIRKPHLSRELAAYWWDYTRSRERYQESLVEDVHVPSILLMVDDSGRVRPTVIWPADVQRRALLSERIPIAQVFPVCDLIMLVWGKLGGTSLKKAIVNYEVVMSSLVELLEHIDGPVAGLRVLRPNRQAAASAVFDSLPKPGLGDLKLIASDGFVDVPLF
ncbi:MAG TPA: hypothetical protein PLF84_19360 [Bryobacteraceae bacterium]|nr:hypothetical protein [Bryobacteraceae bacterium]